MVLYDVSGLFHSKPDCMGHARTLPELLFHEDKILEPKIMLYYIILYLSAHMQRTKQALGIAPHEG